MSVNLITDTFDRRHEYLRISLTDRCNLRCKYCMPAEGIPIRPREEILKIDEILALARIFVVLGVHKIRLTGGEPLVRKGVEELCSQLSAIPGLTTLALSTNGILLEEKAETLHAAGVRHINISLDTLRPERFEHISLRGGFDRVLAGISAASKTGFASVKINTVVMRDFNDDELPDFISFAVDKSLNVRFIEYMPFLGNRWNEVRFISYGEMKERISRRHQLIPILREEGVRGTAKEYRVAGTDAVIGFIPTISERFCDSCNRLRLTADGKLRNCLFAREETDLKLLLRSGAKQRDIERAIQACVIAKWERHPDIQELAHSGNAAMVTIGG